MPSRTTLLQDKKQGLIAQARACVEEAERAGRKELTGEDEAKYQRYVNEIGTVDAAIVEARKQELVANVTAKAAGRFATTDSDNSTLSGSTSAELREFCTPKSALTEWTMPTPNRQFRANEFYKDTGGTVKAGYTYTPEMYATLMAHLNAASGVIEGGATIISTDHQRDILVPTMITDAASQQTAELSPATQAETVFDQKTFKAWRQDGFFLVSAELLATSQYDLERFLGDYAGRAIATRVAAAVSTDTGTTMPDGLVHATTSGVTAGAVAVVTSDEMIDLYRSVALPYRRIGSFIVSDGLFGQMLKWKNDSGDYLVRTVDGAPATFLGRPLYVEPAMADPASATKTAIFGDISRYFIRTTPVLFERSDQFLFTSFVVAFRFAVWMDAHLIDVASCRALTMKA